MEKRTGPEIEVRNLTIGYGNKVVLKDLNFQVESGEIFCILGGSGCGKSTLLKHIIGLYAPQKGDILIQGDSIVQADERHRREIMRRFGVTYQGGALFSSMSLAENVALPLEEYTQLSAKEIARTVEEKLRLVDLAGFGNYMPAELSGGMAKRAGLARALALNPKLLFFDERRTTGSYRTDDLRRKHELRNDPEAAALERRVKAFVQQYYRHLEQKDFTVE